MLIRFLTQDDIVEHDKVSSQAFALPCKIGDPDSVLPCENVLGVFDDENKTLFADLEILDRKCNYDGGMLTCAAVGGVAAKPEHRGKGAVKALFDYLFRETDYDVSILYPFSEVYYRKLGYERAGCSLRASVPFSAIADVRRNNDVWLYDGGNTAQLLEIYNRCARPYNLSFVRENAHAFSDEPYLSQKYTYVWQNHSFATISVDRENSILFVHEIYFDSCASMLGILGFLRNFEGNQKTIGFQKLPDNTPLLSFLRELPGCNIGVYNTGSVRIMHMEKVLKAHHYPAQTAAFTMQVCDEVYKVTVEKDGVTVDKNRSASPDVVMDIPTASKVLLSGFSDASYIPGLVIRNPRSDFFTLFPPKTTFFTDAF